MTTTAVIEKYFISSDQEIEINTTIGLSICVAVALSALEAYAFYANKIETDARVPSAISFLGGFLALQVVVGTLFVVLQLMIHNEIRQQPKVLDNRIVTKITINRLKLYNIIHGIFSAAIVTNSVCIGVLSKVGLKPFGGACLSILLLGLGIFQKQLTTQVQDNRLENFVESRV